MSEAETLSIPVYVDGDMIGSIFLHDDMTASVRMYPGTVSRLRSDILSIPMSAIGVVPVAQPTPDQNIKDARIEAVRALAQLGSVHPQSFTRVAGDLEGYILNGYTEPDSQRTEAKFIERLRFRGFGEVEISDIMTALRDGELSVYKTRK